MLNTIKKQLYKLNPVALLIFVDKEGLYYQCSTELNTITGININFKIPITDLGDAKFLKEMEAKHLIRYINNYNTFTI